MQYQTFVSIKAEAIAVDRDNGWKLCLCAVEQRISMDRQTTQNSWIDSLVSLLKVATRIGSPMRDGVADPEQLSVMELRIMLALGGEGGLAGHELAELMAMQPMNVSRALASLAKMDLVKLSDNNGNRRRKPYRLTVSGVEKYDNMMLRMQEVSQFVFSGFDKNERRQLDGLLLKLDKTLIKWESPPETSHINRA